MHDPRVPLGRRGPHTISLLAVMAYFITTGMKANGSATSNAAAALPE